MAKWKKKTSYGDYKDPLQNHKFTIIVTNKNGEVVRAENAHKVLVNQVRNCYGKHVGSKRLKSLLSFIAKSDNIKSVIKTFNAKLEAINKKSEEEALNKQE